MCMICIDFCFQILKSQEQIYRSINKWEILIQYKIVRIAKTMEIELEEMEHGKVLNLGNLTEDKKTKVRLMKAKKQYKQLLQYANSLPPNKDKYMLKANALMHLKQWTELIQCCNRGLQIEEDSQFYNMKGRALGKQNQMQQKVDNVKKAIELDPTVPAYYRNYGAALYKLKKYNSAIENHKLAIQKQPQNSINYHNVGAALFRLQKYEEAKQFFANAISKNGKEALSHSWLGDCYKELGELQKAVDCYTRAYQISGKQLYKNERDKLQKQINPKKGFFSKLFS